MKRALILVLTLTTLLCSCSPGFVIRSGYEEAKILINRRSIASLIQDPRTDETTKAKLKLVLSARNFAIQHVGLTSGGAFTNFSPVESDVLLWVLAASRPDSFTLFSWWYPIVGRIPYKGFFDRDDAIRAGQALKSEGFEYYIRGSDAFSTLGWFDDPVLSTTLKRADHEIVNTVVHESVHSTIWIKGNVPFNESLANFVGFQATIEYEELKVGSNIEKVDTSAALSAFETEVELAQLVTKLYDELYALYETDSDLTEKLTKREMVFKGIIKPFRERHPNLRILKQLNNAEVMQLKFYLTGFEQFASLYHSCNSSWTIFFAKIREINRLLTEDSSLDPFVILKSLR